MGKTTLRTCRSAILFAVFAGCAVGEVAPLDTDRLMLESQQRIDRDRHLIARVQRGEISVAFHEPQAGQVVISQVGRDSALPFQLPSNPLAAFAAAAPGVEVPQVLTEAVARAAGAPGQPPPLEAAAMIVVPSAPTAFGSFPKQAFSCWAHNRYTCLYDVNSVTLGTPATTSVNVVWAVDRGWVTAYLRMWRPDGSLDPWNFETYEGWWRVFQYASAVPITGDFDIESGDGRAADVNFHFSSAGVQ